MKDGSVSSKVSHYVEIMYFKFGLFQILDVEGIFQGFILGLFWSISGFDKNSGNLQTTPLNFYQYLEIGSKNLRYISFVCSHLKSTKIKKVIFHTAQKCSFPLRISSENETESEGNCGFGLIY